MKKGVGSELGSDTSHDFNKLYSASVILRSLGECSAQKVTLFDVRSVRPRVGQTSCHFCYRRDLSGGVYSSPRLCLTFPLPVVISSHVFDEERGHSFIHTHLQQAAGAAQVGPQAAGAAQVGPQAAGAAQVGAAQVGAAQVGAQPQPLLQQRDLQQRTLQQRTLGQRILGQ